MTEQAIFSTTCLHAGNILTVYRVYTSLMFKQFNIGRMMEGCGWVSLFVVKSPEVLISSLKCVFHQSFGHCLLEMPKKCCTVFRYVLVEGNQQ